MASSVSLTDVLSRYQLTEQQLDIPCSEKHSDEVARELVNWELLAYSLGLIEGEVVAIQEENPKNYPLQRLKSLRKWRQKMGKRASYLHLARGLEREGRMDLVGTLCELLSQSSDEVKESEETTKIDSDTKTKLEQFEERFQQLATMTLEELEEGKVTTRRLRLDLTLLPQEIKPNHLTYIESNIKTLRKAEDLEEIFLHLNLYWDSFNYTLLEMIVSKHGSAGLKQRMETYVSEITTFMRETTVAEYITVCGGQQRPTITLEEFKELKCRLNKPANRCTLLEIVDLRCRFCQRLQLPEFALKLFQLEDTSVTVTWLIHEELLHLFNELSFEDAKLLSPDIESISVGGQYKRLKSDVTHPAMAVKTDKPVRRRRLEGSRPPDYIAHPHKTLQEVAVQHGQEARPPSPPPHAQRSAVGVRFVASVGGYIGLTLGAVLGSVLGVGAGVGASVGLVVGALLGCCIGLYTHVPPAIVKVFSGIGIGGSIGATIGASVSVPWRSQSAITRSMLGGLLGGLQSSVAGTSAYAFAAGELIGMWINALLWLHPARYRYLLVMLQVSIVGGIVLAQREDDFATAARVRFLGAIGFVVGTTLPHHVLGVTFLYVIGGLLSWFGLHELSLLVSLGTSTYFVIGPPYPLTFFLEATVLGSISGGLGWVLSKAGLIDTFTVVHVISGAAIGNLLHELLLYGEVAVVVAVVMDTLQGLHRGGSGGVIAMAIRGLLGSTSTSGGPISSPTSVSGALGLWGVGNWALIGMLALSLCTWLY